MVVTVSTAAGMSVGSASADTLHERCNELCRRLYDERQSLDNALYERCHERGRRVHKLREHRCKPAQERLKEPDSHFEEFRQERRDSVEDAL